LNSQNAYAVISPASSALAVAPFLLLELSAPYHLNIYIAMFRLLLVVALVALLFAQSAQALGTRKKKPFSEILWLAGPALAAAHSAYDCIVTLPIPLAMLLPLTPTH